MACLLRLLMCICLAAPLGAMNIIHGDTAIQPAQIRTEQALIVASEEAASLGWMQMYVFHPDPAEREHLLQAGHQLGAMGVLPAGSELMLLAMARNGGALMAEILSVGAGDTSKPARGADTDRRLPAADESYPFTIPPAPKVRLQWCTGARICLDTADALSASPALRLLLPPGLAH